MQTSTYNVKQIKLTQTIHVLDWVEQKGKDNITDHVRYWDNGLPAIEVIQRSNCWDMYVWHPWDDINSIESDGFSSLNEAKVKGESILEEYCKQYA